MKENYIDFGTNPKRRIQKVRHAKSYPNMMAFWCAEVARVKNRKRNNSGFSLIELIIVIAIMAILAAAIAPALIRYVDKSRKGVDIETAQTIFEAANLASATSNEDANAGWYISADTSNGGSVGRVTVSEDGHNVAIAKGKKGAYTISVVAWARGIDYNGWQNAQFKSVLDGNTGGIKDSLKLQQAFTDEFLLNLGHKEGVGETYKGAGKNNYDGKRDTTMEFRYKKDPGMGKPECWILCIRNDNYTPEVWIGDKRINSTSNGSVRAIYRLYPNPCEEYRN